MADLHRELSFDPPATRFRGRGDVSAALPSRPVSELRKAIDAYIENSAPDLELEVTFQEESGADCGHEVTYVWVDRIEPMGTADSSAASSNIHRATVGGLTFVCDFRVHVDVTTGDSNK